MRNRRILTAGLVLFVLTIITALFMLASGPKYDPKAPKEPERGGPTTVSIGNTETLSQLLLYNEFVTVKDTLSAYILSQTNGSSTSAEIVLGSTKRNQDGSVAFSVKSDKLSKPLDVALTFPSLSEIIFSVPSNNYQLTVYPYGQ